MRETTSFSSPSASFTVVRCLVRFDAANSASTSSSTSRPRRFDCPERKTAGCPVTTPPRRRGAPRTLPASGIPDRTHAAHRLRQVRRSPRHCAVGAPRLASRFGRGARDDVRQAHAGRGGGGLPWHRGQAPWRVVFHYVDCCRRPHGPLRRQACRHDVPLPTRPTLHYAGRRHGGSARCSSPTAQRRYRASVRDHLEERGGDASASSRLCIDMSPHHQRRHREPRPRPSHLRPLPRHEADRRCRRRGAPRGGQARPELKGTRYVWTRTSRSDRTPKARCRHPRLYQPQDRAPWRSALPSGIYRRSDPRVGRAVLRQAGPAGPRPIPARAHARPSTHHAKAPGRAILRPVRQPHQQRPDRGHQLPARRPLKPRPEAHRNSETLKRITYLIAGKLDLKLPT